MEQSDGRRAHVHHTRNRSETQDQNNSFSKIKAAAMMQRNHDRFENSSEANQKKIEENEGLN